MLRSQRFIALCILALGCSCRRHLTVNAPAPAPASSLLTLPPGTLLAVCTAEAIDSEHPSENRAYAAVISRDLRTAETQNLLPSGSPVTLVLISAGGAANNGMAWELGMSSATVNGDAFLVRHNGSPSPLGTFLGGVPGTFYPDTRNPNFVAPLELTVSSARVQVSSGSLLTFRLQNEIVLAGSGGQPK